MSETSELDLFVADIRAAAKESGALVIEAPLEADRDIAPSAVIEAGDAGALVRHVRPRLVYLMAAPFDAGDELLDAFEDAEESDLDRPEVKKLVAKWRKRDGQTCRVAFSLVCDGVIHDVIEEAGWLAEFESEAEDLAIELEEAATPPAHGRH